LGQHVTQPSIRVSGTARAAYLLYLMCACYNFRLKQQQSRLFFPAKIVFSVMYKQSNVQNAIKWTVQA